MTIQVSLQVIGKQDLEMTTRYQGLLDRINHEDFSFFPSFSEAVELIDFVITTMQAGYILEDQPIPLEFISRVRMAVDQYQAAVEADSDTNL